MHLLFLVIAVNSEPNVSWAHPVLGYCIVFFESVHEVFRVLPVQILNPETVHA